MVLSYNFDILVVVFNVTKFDGTKIIPILDNVKKYIVVNFNPIMTQDNFNKSTYF